MKSALPLCVCPIMKFLVWILKVWLIFVRCRLSPLELAFMKAIMDHCPSYPVRCFGSYSSTQPLLTSFPYFSSSGAVATELRDLSEHAKAIHRTHAAACDYVVLQQHLLSVDMALINTTRHLESNTRQYIYYTNEQARLLELLKPKAT
jgi:hypothetical protein